MGKLKKFSDSDTLNVKFLAKDPSKCVLKDTLSTWKLDVCLLLENPSKCVLKDTLSTLELDVCLLLENPSKCVDVQKNVEPEKLSFCYKMTKVILYVIAL